MEKQHAIDVYEAGILPEKQVLFLAWFDYLALSPSYDQARRLEKGERLEGETICADIGHVRRIYRDFGDVQQTHLADWWRRHRVRSFGQFGDEPAVASVGVLSPDVAPGILSERIKTYRETAWIDQDRPRVLIAAIPARVSDAELVRAVREAMEIEGLGIHRPTFPAPQYGLVGSKHHLATIFRYWQALRCRADNPEEPLWKIGAAVGLSATHAPEPLTDLSQLDPNAYDRQALKVLTMRALTRGHMIAENAARGIFPSHKKHSNALKLDYDTLAKLIRRRERWLTQQRLL